MKYKKRPITVDVILWTGKNIKEIMDFMSWRNANYDNKNGLVIHTLEGNHSADVGDYIVKGIKSEFYPVKPDIFALTYERLE